MKIWIITISTAITCLAAYLVLANPIVPIKSSESVEKIDETFKTYWYAGEAEVTSYNLEQARYGEIRDGQAVLIFVTEDFSQSKQVKLDNPSGAASDAVSVLKMNQTRKFLTGIYPYSVMQSTFTPVDLQEFPATLKTSFSSQEWCGHVYNQLNLVGNAYDQTSFSYFESEGDIKNKIPQALLEDELFNRIRIDPESIENGQVQIIPSSIYARLSHDNLQTEVAKISRSEKDGVVTLHVKYENIERSLSIYYQKSFPHIIEGWEEVAMSGWGDNARKLTTTASRKKSIKTAYWGLNSNADAHWRQELELN
jgi:hypothetical protein